MGITKLILLSLDSNINILKWIRFPPVRAGYLTGAKTANSRVILEANMLPTTLRNIKNKTTWNLCLKRRRVLYNPVQKAGETI